MMNGESLVSSFKVNHRVFHFCRISRHYDRPLLLLLLRLLLLLLLFTCLTHLLHLSVVPFSFFLFIICPVFGDITLCGSVVAPLLIVWLISSVFTCSFALIILSSSSPRLPSPFGHLI